jgi:hypothetical protein
MTNMLHVQNKIKMTIDYWQHLPSFSLLNSDRRVLIGEHSYQWMHVCLIHNFFECQLKLSKIPQNKNVLKLHLNPLL